MAFFKFAKSQLLKNIDWLDSTNDTMVYRFPMNGREIMMGSKLTVRESQVAVFMVKGKVADVFTPGIHTLIVSNLPVLSALLSWPRGFRSPFTADVFFVNTKQFVNQKWGTTNPILMRDKEFGSVRIRSYGSFSFRVNDAKLFLHEVFGTNSLYTTENIISYLKSILVSGISDTIAESKISALDLACNLLEFNELSKRRVNEMFCKIGLMLTNLIIENISFPEQVEQALDTKTSMGVLKNNMDTYMMYKSAEALSNASKNPGSAGVGMQLGAGIMMGEMLKKNLSHITSTESNKNSQSPGFKFCPKCGSKNALNAKFCTQCGNRLSSGNVLTCPFCGAKITEQTKFCPECGKKIR